MWYTNKNAAKGYSKSIEIKEYTMEKICYIIGAGDVPVRTKIKATDEDYIICADRGFAYSSLLGRKCDLVVGDFDSYGKMPEFENTVILPCDKDDTDMKVAVDEGLKRGYRSFVLFGALGGDRYDHSVANIALLAYICSKGARCTILHDNKIFTAFADGEITLSADNKGYISVFSLCDESEGVTIEGLKYEVDGISLRFDTPVGVSNEFIGKEAHISVKKGRLMVVYNG